ncbi:hypothetical protein Vretimale_12428 [Volvox reticuliferus]|uniref:Uncharacterized protein n=1 Tax=Volvox reticuliferus TaxID=1737510 RepID=A0A8J4LTA5_9CHLO|nr:hypothetical protein Vretimale_12428 [Volvox reticuliferus]
MHYNLQWVRELLSARINCLIEFSSRGRDGLVALHQRYFATAEHAIQDEVLQEYNDEFACARQKVSLKYLAEKEHKSRSGGSTGASQFNGARLRRGWFCWSWFPTQSCHCCGRELYLGC